MRLKVDKENDALDLRLDEAGIIDSEEVQPGVILDLNKDNRVVGIIIWFSIESSFVNSDNTISHLRSKFTVP